MKKLLFLTSQDSSASVEILRRLLKDLPDATVHLIFERRPRSFSARLRGQLRHLRKNGLLWIPYRLIVAVRDVVGSLLNSEPPTPGLLESLNSIASASNERFTFELVPDLHNQSLLQRIAGDGYELGIVFGTRILQRKLFSLPRYGMINIHQGLIPLYRGMPPAFWELYNGEEETGVSIHAVSDVLDGGGIVLQERVRIPPSATLLETQKLLDELAARILPEAVRLGSATTHQFSPTDLENGKCYTQPTVFEKIKFWWKRRKR